LNPFRNSLKPKEISIETRYLIFGLLENDAEAVLCYANNFLYDWHT
jgi:hypothetical protein